MITVASGQWTHNHNSFHWKQGLFGEKLWKKFVKWIIDLASPLRHEAHFGAFGLRAMTKFVTNVLVINPKLSTSFGEELIMKDKAAWAKVVVVFWWLAWLVTLGLILSGGAMCARGPTCTHSRCVFLLLCNLR